MRNSTFCKPQYVGRFAIFVGLGLIFGAITTDLPGQQFPPQQSGETQSSQKSTTGPFRVAFGTTVQSPDSTRPTTPVPAQPINSAMARPAGIPAGLGASQNRFGDAGQSGSGKAVPFRALEQGGEGKPITRVSKSMPRLPNAAGQVWREYDITPYTSRVTDKDNPQQAILDWVLNETGTAMWFNEPLGILSANRRQLFVYHTPEIQKVVNSIVDRFVNSRGQVQSMSINLVTVGNPNWRSDAYTMLQPIEVQSAGVEAWMISKENAALLMGSLRRRGDFQDNASGRLIYHDGQSVTIQNRRPVQFVRNLRWTGSQIPGYQPLMTTVDEGYTLTIGGLSSLDGKSLEATIKCDVDQVEKLNQVVVDIPASPTTVGTRVNLQIPQMVSWRLEERFKWPSDQVLLLSCGVVATPKPDSNASRLASVFGANRNRADALVFVEYRGPELPTRRQAGVPATTIPVQSR